VKILVAEDDAIAGRLIMATLQKWGYEPELVTNGALACRRLLSDDFPIAILDWMMPEVAGPDVCREVRAAGRTAIYIILLTAKGETEDIVAGLEAGADDYVRKPFKRDELRARLRVGERVIGLQTSLAQRVRELGESEARLRALFDGAHDGIITMDRDGIIRDLNAAAKRLCGWSHAEAVSRRMAELLIAAPSRATFEARVAESRDGRQVAAADQVIELVAVNKNGGQFPVELWIASISSGEQELLVSFVRDVSERKRLEMGLGQAQKLEAVGRLAAGVAHEINTPIQFVGDNARFLADGFTSLRTVLDSYRPLRQAAGSELAEQITRVEADADLPYLEEEVPKAIAQTIEGVERVATIVRALKQFAHPDAGKEKAFADLNQALQSTVTVARNEIKLVADVELELGQLPHVRCHIGEVNQVFLNLLINAAHAIADVVGDSGQKGRITIRTVQEGESVLIAISDTGCGIPEEVRPSIFDPFFTTKEVGRGTGQGLAIARSVITEKHGGSLTFESEVGRGTTFFVRLPIDGGSGRETAAA